MKKHTVFTSILLPIDIIQTSRSAASRLGISRSQFIRYAVYRALEQLSLNKEISRGDPVAQTE